MFKVGIIFQMPNNQFLHTFHGKCVRMENNPILFSHPIIWRNPHIATRYVYENLE